MCDHSHSVVFWPPQTKLLLIGKTTDPNQITLLGKYKAGSDPGLFVFNSANSLLLVIVGFIPAIHGPDGLLVEGWIPATSAGMTIILESA